MAPPGRNKKDVLVLIYIILGDRINSASPIVYPLYIRGKDNQTTKQAHEDCIIERESTPWEMVYLQAYRREREEYNRK